jgi:hypothetical protein
MCRRELRRPWRGCGKELDCGGEGTLFGALVFFMRGICGVYGLLLESQCMFIFAIPVVWTHLESSRGCGVWAGQKAPRIAPFRPIVLIPLFRFSASPKIASCFLWDLWLLACSHAFQADNAGFFPLLGACRGTRAWYFWMALQSCLGCSAVAFVWGWHCTSHCRFRAVGFSFKVQGFAAHLESVFRIKGRIQLFDFEWCGDKAFLFFFFFFCCSR